MSPEATVDTITFGSPYGSARITIVPVAVPCRPPRPMTPWTFPALMRCSSTLVAPAAMTGWVVSRVGSFLRAVSVVPPARATSARVTSARAAGVPSTPMSTTSARLPSAFSC